MPVTLYWMHLSSPSRAVRMFAKHVGIPLELKKVNLLAGEQNSPAVVTLNPVHQIPILDDNGFILTESRAIIQYLADTYAKKMFHVQDPKERAIINSRFYFDCCTLYPSFFNAYCVSFLKQLKPAPENVEKLNENLGHLEKFLSQSVYVAGDKLTVADFSIMASLSTIDGAGHSLNPFPRVSEYFGKCKIEIRNYEESNEPGATEFGKFVKDSIKALS